MTSEPLKPFQKLQKISYKVCNIDKMENVSFNKKLKQCFFYVPQKSYLSLMFFIALSMAIAFLLIEISILVLYLSNKMAEETAFFFIKMSLITALFSIFVFVLFMITFPYLYAENRKAKIEQQLPFAVNYMSVMAAAGISPDVIFQTMTDQKIKSIYGGLYGEFFEFQKQTSLMGKDIPAALQIIEEQTPSPLFSNFIAGSKNTFISGSSFQKYIHSKKQEYQSLFIRRKEKEIQSLDLFAEVYITLFLAAPLFFIILFYASITFSGPKINEISLLTYNIVPFLGIFFHLLLEIIDSNNSNI